MHLLHAQIPQVCLPASVSSVAKQVGSLCKPRQIFALMSTFLGAIEFWFMWHRHAVQNFLHTSAYVKTVPILQTAACTGVWNTHSHTASETHDCTSS